MAYNNSDEIFITMHSDDKEAFYAKIPYDKLPNVHRIGGKWVQAGKEWRFPLDDEIWEKFQKEFAPEFAAGKVHRDMAFLLAFDKRHKDLQNFLTFKETALKDEPTDFGVDGVSLDGKNCLFNYQRWGIKCGLSVGDGFLIGDQPGLGKAEIVDNRLFTPYGRKRIGDIAIGDEVIGSNGKACKVTGVFPQGNKPVYKITFSDDYSIECAEEHLWTVFSTHLSEPVTLTVKELLDKDKEITHYGSGCNENKVYKYKTFYKTKDGNRWQIPVVQPIQFNRNETLPIDPYLVGLMLGDGSFLKHWVEIAENADDFDEMFNSYLEEGYFDAHEKKSNKPSIRKITFHVGDIMESIGLGCKKAWDKFIPDCYKYASVEDRLALLQGLMDTDGHCQKASAKRKNKNIFTATEFCTVSEKLADDVAELVQTLGGIARKHEKTPFYTKDGERHYCRKAYRLNIKMPFGIKPFKLTRKANAYNTPQKYEVARMIKDIEYVGEKECVCIMVDAPDHLYVTEHCIVTHNTIQGIGIAIERKNRGEIRNCLVICPASLKYNWLDEIHKFTKENALVIGHKCKNSEEREKHWIAEGYFFKIVNYELVARDLYCEPKKKDNRISCAKAVLNSFDMIIIDECQYLKHHSSLRTLAVRSFNAKFRIGLSGTPIDGRLEEIHSIFQILKPGLFVNKQKFMERYAEYDYFGAVKGYHHIKEVSDKIAPYYLRRLKEDVLKDLPPKIFKDMHVELSDKNMRAYKDLIKKRNEITENASAVELLIRARQFLDFPEIIGLHNNSDKYSVFKELIDDLVKENDQKVIVFSEYTNTLYWIMKNLETEYKNILVIDGSVSSEERQEIVKKFNNEDKYKIILMSDAGAEGLNLPSASAVIHYTDSYKPTKMQQRNDRAHRATTKHTVTIYRFITDGTIEEHVRDILARKQAVNNALLGEDCDEFETGEMSALELVSCL